MKKLNSVRISILWLKVKFLALISKICRMLGKTIIYQSKTGLKEINPVFENSDYSGSLIKEIDAKDLCLGIDFLKDSHSLIDVPIAESPHFGLVKALREGENWEKTEYVRRMLKGELDERYEILAFYLEKDYFPNCYKRCMREIENNQEKPITVYRFNDRYYIHDGKHRAALCALLGLKVKCCILDIDNVCMEFNRKKVRHLMRDKHYSRHQKIFQDVKLLSQKEG